MMARISSWLTIVMLVFIVAIVLTPRWQRDRLSCHTCRARKDVQTTWFLFWPISREEMVRYAGRPNIGHEHAWWRYSYVHGDGFPTCGVVRGVACNVDRYADGTVMP